MREVIVIGEHSIIANVAKFYNLRLHPGPAVQKCPDPLESGSSPRVKPGMRIRIRSDPLISGPPDPDPVLFSSDPGPDPTCNNGYIKLFSS